MPALPTLANRRRSRGRVAALVAATIATLGVSIALAPAALAASDTVAVTAPATAKEGDVLSVTLPLDASTDLFAYDLVVTYDPMLLAYVADSATFPDGGYDAVKTSAGSLRLTSTRLGTSPGLAGAQTLASLAFTALDGGTATVTLASATFVDSTNVATTLAAPVAAQITLTAAPTAPTTPEPSPSASTSASPSASPSKSAAVLGAAASAADPLPSTGSNLTVPLIAGAIAVALVALGAVLVIRRRKEATR